MEFIKQFLIFLENHSGIVTAIPVLAAGFWGFIQFREHVADKRFRTYHELIDWLVNEQSQPGGVIKLDRQIAVVYELRHFPKYFSVSKRILQRLQEQWRDGDKAILAEIQLTLLYMESNWIVKLFKK